MKNIWNDLFTIKELVNRKEDTKRMAIICCAIMVTAVFCFKERIPAPYV